MSEDPRVVLSAVQERIVALDGKIGAAHARIDKMELLIRDELKDIKVNFKEMSGELKEVIAYMNRGRGWAAAALLVAGMVGGLVAKVL